MVGGTEGAAEGPHVVIVGGGFGGLACAQRLGGTACRVTLLDRRNYNLFQPLLYQVATAALSPADIAEPIRRTLRRHRNIRVLLAEVVGVDTAAKEVRLRDGGPVGYDVLVIATGSDYHYFGHDAWRAVAPGLKSIHEARQIRHTLLRGFERVERSDDASERRRLLTTVVIGGGPTGVEMAGAVAELGRFMLQRDYRSLRPSDLRVVLVEATPRILAAFPEELARYTLDRLARLGVEVWLEAPVQDVTAERVVTGRGTIPAGCIVWGAGVRATPVADWLGVAGDRAGRVSVDDRLRVRGLEGVYVLGDAALLAGADGRPLPALAQVASQQGDYLGASLAARLAGGGEPDPFRFRNRGNTAVIGRNAAIFDFGRRTLKGRTAWVLWAIVHVWLLINFEKRLLVSVQWFWRYLTRERGARLIDEPDAAADAAAPARLGSRTGAEGPSG